MLSALRVAVICNLAQAHRALAPLQFLSSAKGYTTPSEPKAGAANRLQRAAFRRAF